jgi:hypothetical protein
MGTVLTRPHEIALKAIGGRENPLDKIDKACRAEGPFYGAGWDIDFERPEPGLFEMKVRRCFWRDFFDRHDARAGHDGYVLMGHELDAFGAIPR